ncbi:tyrosine-type recombinase/integrase [Caballeronia sp. dw_19]|uniref:Arm DNA-binding domain-containing protein n=1 Tax=Caballeronia sp. dw_19 TaxID=2719791 RepID=UPI001BCCE913|nr:tyrosine-type recombinase/integrase [Caballeronia sp. dw_19]
MGRDGSGVKAASATTIEISFYYQKERCRERIRWEPTPANIKKATRFREAVLQAIYDGSFVYHETFPNSTRAAKFAKQPGDVETVGTYLEDWLDRKRKHVKASTYDGYRMTINMWVKALGKGTLSDLKRKLIRDELDKMTCVNKTLSNRQSVLRAALDDAVNDELIAINPLFGWTYTIPQAPKEDDDVDPFSAEERELLLANCGELAERNMFKFAFWTGLRTSEFTAVRWTDIDWHRSEIRISRSWTTTAKEPEDTKTKAGRRIVKLLAPALEALEAQKPLTLLANEYIFLNPRTKLPWSGKNPVRTAWIRAITKAKVAYRKPYQTRHTYASMMLSAGEPPMWVAKQMGHSSWVVTAKIYARWMPSADVEAGDKAVEKFSTNHAVEKLPKAG